MLHTNNGIRRIDGFGLNRWDDIRIVPAAFTYAGANDPSLGTWQPGAVGRQYKVWAFKTDDVGYFTVQMPHAYKLGSDIYAHIHWTPRDRGVAEGAATVGWMLDISVVEGDEVAPPSTTYDLTDACQSVDDEHLETPNVQVDLSGVDSLSAMIIGAIYQDGSGTWAGNLAATAPAMMELDFHYIADDMGSRTRHLKR